MGVFADTPSIGVTPAICLGRFVDDALRCALPRTTALDQNTGAAERAPAADRSFAYVDYSDSLCNDRACPADIPAGPEMLIRRPGG